MTDYSVTELNMPKQGLVKLPNDICKYINLKILYCYGNQLTSLDNLPPNLKYLNCNGNQLTSLDNLPPKLEVLECWNNPLKYDFEPTLENIRNYNSSRMLDS